MQVLEIRRSHRLHKKYDALIELPSGAKQWVSFGERGGSRVARLAGLRPLSLLNKRYQQYQDSTPLRAYSHLDHLDIDRRARFYKRHGKNDGLAAQLSKLYLW